MAGLRVLPVEITVLAGRFGQFPAAQPLAFAHLYDMAPELDLGQVEVVPADGGAKRLSAYFDEAVVARLLHAAEGQDTLILILPDAHEGLQPPPLASNRMTVLGAFRGQLRRHVGNGP